MAYDAQGRILEIFPTNQVTEKFRKREFVLEIPDGNYPQQIKFQFAQDKCDILDQHKVGDEVKVAFNLQGKGFTKDGKTNYFNNLNAWRIESAGQSTSPASNTATSDGSTPKQSDKFVMDEADNDLPF